MSEDKAEAITDEQIAEWKVNDQGELWATQIIEDYAAVVLAATRAVRITMEPLTGRLAQITDAQVVVHRNFSAAAASLGGDAMHKLRETIKAHTELLAVIGPRAQVAEAEADDTATQPDV